MSGVVWTVEKGQYSDHRVLCVARTKPEAEAIAAAYNGDEDAWGKAYVNSLPMVSTPERITVFGLECQVWDDGTVDATRESDRTEWDFDMLYPQHAKPATWRWVRAPVHKGKGGRLEVYGTDVERVRRVFSDRRAQLLAEDTFRAKREARG